MCSVTVSVKYQSYGYELLYIDDGCPVAVSKASSVVLCILSHCS